MKQVGLPLRGRPILLITRMFQYDYKPNWTPLCPVTITNYPKDSVLSAGERYPSFEQLEPVDNSFSRTSPYESPVYFPF